jgi:hypothetical protein
MTVIIEREEKYFDTARGLKKRKRFSRSNSNDVTERDARGVFPFGLPNYNRIPRLYLQRKKNYYKDFQGESHA